MKFKKKLYKNKTKVIIGLVFLLILSELIFLLIGKTPSNDKNGTVSQSALLSYAKQIVSTCAKSAFKPTCYDKEIPKLMDSPYELSMENSFVVTQQVQRLDPSYQYCHVLGHALSAREVKKDPSKWKEVVGRCPSGVCSNGCIHGGFQEKFRKESLTDSEIPKVIPDLKTICEEKPNWHPTGLEQASCYHAIGHLTMYISNAEINKALELCDVIAKKSDGRNFTQLCYDGAFMQIFQPLEPEDFALVKGKQPTKETIISYCDNFTGAVRGSCISESWPLFRSDLVKSSDGIVKFCSLEKEGYQDRCFNGIFYVITAQLNFDFEKIKPLCEGLPQKLKPMCFLNIASRMIETDYNNIGRSVAVCNYASPVDPDNQCYNMLLTMSKYNFHPKSKEFYTLCNALPEKWKQQCLQ